MSEAGKLRAAPERVHPDTSEWQWRLTVQRISGAVHPSCVFGRKSIPSRAPLPRFTQNGCARLTIPSISTAAPSVTDAAHTWGGFATANGSATHSKSPSRTSKRTTCAATAFLSAICHHDRILMRRGDILTWITIVYDPVYLTEPVIRSSEYRLALNQQIPPYPCTVIEEVDRPDGVVPHHLPNTNPFLNEFSKKYDIPGEAALGGPETMYPELARKITAAKNPGMKK